MGENVSLRKQHEALACEYLPVTLALKFHMCNAYSKGHLKKKKKVPVFFLSYILKTNKQTKRIDGRIDHNFIS